MSFMNQKHKIISHQTPEQNSNAYTYSPGDQILLEALIGIIVVVAHSLVAVVRIGGTLRHH